MTRSTKAAPRPAADEAPDHSVHALRAALESTGEALAAAAKREKALAFENAQHVAMVRAQASKIGALEFDNERLTRTVAGLADRLGVLEDYRLTREREDSEIEACAEIAAGEAEGASR
jgi:hypothetical protein